MNSVGLSADGACPAHSSTVLVKHRDSPAFHGMLAEDIFMGNGGVW